MNSKKKKTDIIRRMSSIINFMEKEDERGAGGVPKVAFSSSERE